MLTFLNRHTLLYWKVLHWDYLDLVLTSDYFKFVLWTPSLDYVCL